MKKVLRYLKIVLGCFLVAMGLNLFFIGHSIIPAGVFGLATLYASKMNLGLWIYLAIASIVFLFFASIALPIKKVKKTILPFALIPILCYLTKDIGKLVDMSAVDMLLLAIYGGVLVGLGHRFIYKENHYVSGSDVIAAIENTYTNTRLNAINYFLDGVLLLIAIYFYGFESAMYSLISIIIIEILSKRATLGTSDSKVFYIITKKDKEVKNYIIDELGYTLTVFDVKGGFLKTKNTVLMTVIPTKDYYKLREGVKLLDPKAFISITDSYEVINGNIAKKIESI